MDKDQDQMEDMTLADKPIEQLFAELEETLKKLESPDTPLEESFELYEKGIKLVKACSGKIDKVEKQMITLQGDDMTDGEQ